MRRVTSVVLAAFAVTMALSGAVFGQDDPISVRRALMKNNAAEATIAGQMLRGEAPYDATAAAAAMTQIAANAAKIPSLFPEGSDTGDTNALPAIWQNFPDFEAHAAALGTAATAAAAAAAQGQEAFTTAFNAVGQACGGCHQTYRKAM